MEIKIIKKLENYNIIVLKRLNKKINLNMKIWKSLNIHNRIFSRSRNINCNQKIKKTLMKIKLILILKDNGLLF